MKKILLIVFMLNTVIAFGQKITGAWKGEMEIPGTRLPLVFHLMESGDTLTGSFDSPAQSAFGLAFNSLKIKADSLIATVQNINATYLGKFVAEDSINGVWKQGMATFPLSFKWSKEVAPPEKNKDEKEIEIAASNGLTISGTFLSAGIDAPVVIIIAGSGPTDRDGNNPLGVTSDTYKMLAQALYKNHISSYRYDKRGIGKSSLKHLDESKMRFADIANDADSVVNYFRNQGYKKILIAGHSEGSLIGMLVAQKIPVAGYISISGVGVSADQILEEQLSGKIAGLSDSAIHHIVSQIKKGNMVTDIPSGLAAIFRPSVQPYLSSWFQYNPASEIKKLDCPALIIQGTCDAQVGVSNATALFNAAKMATIKIIPNMSHTLKDAGKDCVHQQETYTDRELPIDAEMVRDIVGFVRGSKKR